jgi:3-methyladenine DNA glycosylase AlkC
MCALVAEAQREISRLQSTQNHQMQELIRLNSKQNASLDNAEALKEKIIQIREKVSKSSLSNTLP